VRGATHQNDAGFRAFDRRAGTFICYVYAITPVA